jgi:hypothetical protein
MDEEEKSSVYNNNVRKVWKEERKKERRKERKNNTRLRFFFEITFYLQSVPVHLANCVKLMQVSCKSVH